MVGSDGLNVCATDTFSHKFELFHIANSSVPPSWLGGDGGEAGEWDRGQTRTRG